MSANGANLVGEIGERAGARSFRLDDQVITGPGDTDADLARAGIRPGVDRTGDDEVRGSLDRFGGPLPPGVPRTTTGSGALSARDSSARPSPASVKIAG